ncbi:MAG: carbohydrate ABC transporter permease [Spirochaetota bacterium]|nr:MAG: carbohydrate ABC transporter permease [Spirochaetota bacterium]
MIIYIAFIIPFSVLFITNFFKSIPKEIVEASRIDGCNDIKILFSIFIPISRAPIITMFVVNALWVWNDLLIALLFLQAEEKKTLMVAIANFQSRMTYNPTMIFASLTIATIPIVILYAFSQRYFVKGLTAGYFR